MVEEKEENVREERIRAITKLYYSNPKVQENILEFAKNREVVPRYLNGGFGKRPDSIQYPSDIMGLVNKGASSFHASEEIWFDPLKINSDMSQEEMNEIRKSWDLLIDIDSKYLDYSKIAAYLIIRELEKSGIKNYGIKFSGSKGFHIIVSSKAFPEELDGLKTKDMFPEWPRAICKYLIDRIKPDYNKIVKEKINFDLVKLRTNLSKEDVTSIVCPKCGEPSKKGKNVFFKCKDCGAEFMRINPRITKKGMRCISEGCMGMMEIEKEEECYYCENCKISNIDKMGDDGDRNVKYTKFALESAKGYSKNFDENISAEILGGLDLVLVSPRHLFRMPYSLHEKTALASVVIKKSDIENFDPKEANPLKVKIVEFLPNNEKDEARRLLIDSLNWKKEDDYKKEKITEKKYEYNRNSKIEISGVTENMFPVAIKKLLKGLNDGKKRGLFILITFLRSLNFSEEYINNRIREWNKLNTPPLKDGYVKSQIDWHMKQKKKILPPNYDNEAFYKDLGLLETKPKEKNPIVEVIRKARGFN